MSTPGLRRIEASKPGKGRRSHWLELTLEGGEKLSLHAEATLSHGLYAGAMVDEATLAAAQETSERHHAREVAWRLVEHRPRSRGELLTGLAKRGVSAPIAEQTVAHMEASGYINDESYARQLADEGLRRGDGSRRVEARLRRRGVDGEMARNAAHEGRTAEGDFQAARGLLTRWNRRSSPADPQKRRMAAARFLAARGYDADVVWRVVGEVLGSESR